LAEVTSQQIDQLTKALEGLEKKLAGGGGSGGGGGGGGAGGGENYTRELGKSIKTASGDFIGAMGTGSISLTKLTESSMGMVEKTLPGLGSVFKTVGVEAIKYMEQSRTSFNALAKAGGGFEGNLGELNRAAAATRMPLDEFTNLMASNAQNLTALGGGINEGSRRFAELSSAMFDTGTIDAFMNLGMTLEESNEFLMDSIALQRRSGVFQKMNDAERVRSAAEMAKSFDTLSKLTGKQAKDIKNELMERQNAGATQAKLRLLEKQGVAGATDAYNAAQKGLAGGPAVLRNLMDDLVQTGVPMSKATQAFAATNKEAFALAKQAAEATKRGDTEAAAKFSEQAAAKALEYANSEQGLRLATLSQVSDIAKGQADALEEVGATIDALNENAKRMKDSTGELATTAESYANLLKKMATETENQVQLNNKNQQALKFMNEAQVGLGNASKVARDGLAGVIESNDTITTALGKAAKAINETFNPELLNGASRALTSIGSEENRAQEAEAITGNPNASAEEVAKTRREGAEEGDIKSSVDEVKITDGILGWFKGFFGGDKPIERATGGSISPGNTYVAGEQGPEIITDSVGSVMNAAQTASAIDTGNQNAGQDITKLIDAMTTANEQLSTLIAINTRQAVLGDKQIKAIRGAGNLIKGI
tara:strand:+ start:2285 stop:4246 length:1962 start_codon:yes stop_codon:yes gene_type:complete